MSRPRVARPRRHVRLVADLGLTLLPVLLVETLTGLMLFLAGHGLAPKGTAWGRDVFDWLAATNLLALQDMSFQTDLHVWVGYLTVWTIAWKIWASWPTLIGWWPRRYTPSRRAVEKVMAWSLLVLAPASYLSGTALDLRLLPHVARAVRDVHLIVSALFVVPFAWHVWRFLPTGLKVLWVQLKHLLPRHSHPARPSLASR